jgi:hypothetical protein
MSRRLILATVSLAALIVQPHPSVPNGLSAVNTQFFKSTGADLCGQVIWTVADALTIQPGARINQDKKRGFYRRRVQDGAGVEISCFNPAPPAGPIRAVQCGVDGNYRSSFSSNPSKSIYTNVKGYALTNVRFGVRTDRFDIYGWVRNAFDVDTFELLQVAPGNVGLIAGRPGDPQTWGGKNKFSF